MAHSSVRLGLDDIQIGRELWTIMKAIMVTELTPEMPTLLKNLRSPSNTLLTMGLNISGNRINVAGANATVKRDNICHIQRH